MQNKVKEFNQTIPHKKAMPTMARLMDISSELGELLKESSISNQPNMAQKTLR